MPAPPTVSGVRVAVPASSANLGPGYDSLGLALAWHDEVEVRTGEPGLRIEVSGEGAGTLPLDADHLVVRAMHETFDALGEPLPGLTLSCRNRIPHGRGLGSSSAAIVAGVLAARGISAGGARLGTDDVLALAARIEGHPDNVAAALLGGATIAWVEDGRARAVRVEPAAVPEVAVCVPAHALATEKARALLPDVVPHAAAAANVARAALLVTALQGRPDLLLAATEDRLHQDYREPAMPESLALVRRLRAVGIPAVVSGAGPTVLAFPRTPDEHEVVTRAGGASGDGRGPGGAAAWLVRSVAVDLAGARVEPV